VIQEGVAVFGKMVVAWSLIGGGVLEPTSDSTARFRPPTSVTGPAFIITRRVDSLGYGNADTSEVRIVAGAGSLGIPFGHFKEPEPGNPYRTGGDLVVPLGELGKLPLTRARGGRVLVNVVGGGKCSLDSLGQWQMALWTACWRRNLTVEKREQVLAYRDSGVVVGTYLIDEPNLLKRWGVIRPSDVCQMAAYARQDLPGIPVVARVAAVWLGSCPYLDAAWGQYGSRRGVSVEAYRAEHLRDSERYGYTQIFSLNSLNDDASGTDMSAAQVKEYGTVLLGNGQDNICYFMVWEYHSLWSERSDIRAALDSLGRIAEKLPRRSCWKPT
jgi:hypothetical protein